MYTLQVKYGYISTCMKTKPLLYKGVHSLNNTHNEYYTITRPAVHKVIL